MKQNFKKHFGLKRFAFSLVELMISLIVISLIAAAFAPVVTKKLSSSSIISGNMGKITSDCSLNENFGSGCELCTESYCIVCPVPESCTEEGYYKDTKLCACKKCSENASYGEGCLSCDNKKCLKCDLGYYLNNGSCEKCQGNEICDGFVKYDNCPYGHYCKNNKMYSCKNEFDSNCSECTEHGCTRCDDYYYTNPNGSKETGYCELCNAGGACIKCSSGPNKCDICEGGNLLDSNGQCTIPCSSKIEGCYYCDGESKCGTCKYGYYKNSSEKCSKCSISNCTYCKQGMSEENPSCSTCKGGYYLENGNCVSCSTKFGSNCAFCDSSRCYSCKRGYEYQSQNATNSSACIRNYTTKFICSDENFMRIGNVCVTRKNMGDDSVNLPISANVIIADASMSQKCDSENALCCWKNTSTGGCDSANGDYSGCNRTLCNLAAAKEICKNFQVGGGNWRLPTMEESKMFQYLSVEMGNDGLMFCDREQGAGSSYCWWGGSEGCSRSGLSDCVASYVWSSDSYFGGDMYYHFALYAGTPAIIARNKSNPHSVRCVKEMSD